MIQTAQNSSAPQTNPLNPQLKQVPTTAQQTIQQAPTSPTSPNNLNKKNKKLILGGLFLLLLIVGTGAAYWLTQQSQDIRQQAGGSSYTCENLGGQCLDSCGTLALKNGGIGCPTNQSCCEYASCDSEGGECIDGSVCAKPIQEGHGCSGTQVCCDPNSDSPPAKDCSEYEGTCYDPSACTGVGSVIEENGTCSADAEYCYTTCDTGNSSAKQDCSEYEGTCYDPSECTGSTSTIETQGECSVDTQFCYTICDTGTSSECTGTRSCNNGQYAACTYECADLSSCVQCNGQTGLQEPVNIENCLGKPCNPYPNEDCSIEGDEDGDGLANCQDPDCQNSSYCTSSEDCSIEGDEDGDGLANCQDPDCYAEDFCTNPSCGNGQCDADLGEYNENCPEDCNNYECNTYVNDSCADNENCHCTGGDACTGTECLASDESGNAYNYCINNPNREWCTNWQGFGMTCCDVGYECCENQDGCCPAGGGGGGGGGGDDDEYSCNSSCDSNEQCQTASSSYTCYNGSCRLATNPTASDCQPAEGGPQCLNISISNEQPEIGDQVTFTCANVPEADHYIFRVKTPDQNFQILSATGRQSAPLTISQPGQHFGQCQICTGTSDSTCGPWESI